MLRALSLAVIILTLQVLAGCQLMTAKPAALEPSLPQPTGDATAEDAALSGVIKKRLSAEKAVDLSRVVVVTSKGTVYLSGAVSSLEARERALKIPWQVSGVRSVVNHLQVAE
ncbi:MAG: BON domain-containing protein [Candidatus Binatia bacterium]